MYVTTMYVVRMLCGKKINFCGNNVHDNNVRGALVCCVVKKINFSSNNVRDNNVRGALVCFVVKKRILVATVYVTTIYVTQKINNVF